MFVILEYNCLVLVVLKNVLDVGLCLYGESVWDKKLGFVVSVLLGVISGFGVNYYLR